MRSSPRRSRRLTAVAAALLVIGGASADAHRRDEYLQAARLAVDPDRIEIELDLTPGIAVADRILAEIDLDENAVIDESERRAYAERVLNDLTLEVDGVPLVPDVIDSTTPSVASMREGEGAIRITMAASLSNLGAGVHHVRYRNVHRADVGVYLANALVPANERVLITSQQRDHTQHELVIAYTLRSATSFRTGAWLAGSAASAMVLGFAILWRRRSRQAR